MDEGGEHVSAIAQTIIYRVPYIKDSDGSVSNHTCKMLKFLMKIMTGRFSAIFVYGTGATP